MNVKPDKGRGTPAFIYANGELKGRGYVYCWGWNPKYIPHMKPLIHNGRKPR